MPGRLAGLFAEQSAPLEAVATVQHPVRANKPASPSEIHEQLRALNDPDTVLQGEVQVCALSEGRTRLCN